MKGELVYDLRQRLENLCNWVNKCHSDKDGFLSDTYDAAYCKCLEQVIGIIDEMIESPLYKK